MIKRKHILIYIFMSLVVTTGAQTQVSRMALNLKSVSIQGKTNMNCFTFNYNDHNNLTTSLFAQSKNDVAFQIPVRDFETSNPGMKRDFVHLLKADDYPQIKVEIDKKQLQNILKGQKYNQLNMNLSFAGTDKKVESKYKTKEYSKNKLLLEGYTQVRLTEFNLKPPQKMLGIVQVKDEILIKFDVILSLI